MPRIDRKVKREMARSLKARGIRERKMMNQAYNLGLELGTRMQKAKVENATLGMEYPYEYSVLSETDASSIGNHPGGSSDAVVSNDVLAATEPTA